MSTSAPAALERLRPGGTQRPPRVRPEEAEIFVPPRFAWLVLLAIGAIILQSTLLHSFSLRAAHVSLLTVLLVWAGLRCGVTTGGALGFIAGLVEDALGSGGTNVLATTLVGFGSGLLSVRFFADSLPVFASAVAAATILRGTVTYLVLEIGLGERGMFHRLSHEVAWQTLLNCLVAIVAVLWLRAPARARR